jgi:hypothetical protein
MVMLLDQGECVYLHRRLADGEAVTDFLRERLAAGLGRDADRSR